MTFDTWIDTFISEKGLDLEHTFEVPGPSGVNIMPLAVVVDAMKQAPEGEQTAIRDKVVVLDFHNAPILPFFEHLAGALAI
jgi:hypothetical protein